MGFGGLFEGGEVAAFVADFVAGGFAGPGAGAVFAVFVEPDGRLGPMFRFFHGVNVARGAAREYEGFHPMAVGCEREQGLVPMKFPNDHYDGAGSSEEAVHENETKEPLFGDERWIEERLQVLRTQAGGAESQATA